MINAIIVDDEQNNIEGLKNLLSNYCPEVNIVGTAGDVNAAHALIKKINPQLVFLDIEMPFGNAFDLLEKLIPVEFEVVFVTAFDQYAVRAFKYAAADYLLKPVSIDELQKAVGRVQQRIAE